MTYSMTSKNIGSVDTERHDGMQETIRAFFLWLSKNVGRFKENIADAGYLFWTEREGLADIKPDEATEMVFNEWLMFDYSHTGYDGTPYAKRRNLLSVFLEEKGSTLSPAARAFVDSAMDSYPSVCRIISVVPGKGEVIEDLFTGNRIQVTDRNLSRLVKPGMSVFGRFVRSGRGDHISAGSAVLALPTPQDEYIMHFINGAREMAAEAEGQEPALSPFLKWNSYVYYREMLSWRQSGFPFEEDLPDQEEEEILGAILSLRKELEGLRMSLSPHRRRRKKKSS